MIYKDYNREWKKYQRKHLQNERKRIEELKKIHQDAIRDEIKEVENELNKAKQTITEKKEEIAQVEKALKDIDDKLYIITQKYEFLKAKTNYLKWQIEQNTVKAKKEGLDKKKIVYIKLLEEQNKLAKEIQDIEYEKHNYQNQLKKYTATLNEIVAKKENIEKKSKELARQLKDFEENFQNTFRNLPIADYISPTLNIKQVVLPHLSEDYHFAKVPKIDRCMTCHLNIDRPGFENAPQPFTTHPKLELFVGDMSYHPINKFGCTICHSGSGRSTTFIGAAHTPKNDLQRKEWEKKYNWHESHLWDFPMLPSQYIESSCLKCHSQQALIPFAPKINKGRAIVRNSGCFGCHKIDGFETLREVGPTLIAIASKVSPVWIENWIKNPHDWNPNSRMPQPFFLSNTSSDEDKIINNIFIKGITNYLYDNSFPVNLENIPKNINPNLEEGKRLFNLRGCIACHTIGDSVERDNVRRFGPDLKGVGSKLRGESGLKWLYTWIKNPHSIFPETKMPNMRLKDEEVVHISAYLQSLTNNKTVEGIKDLDTKTLEELTRFYLAKNYNVNELKDLSNILTTELLKIKKLALEDFLDYTGKYNSLYTVDFLQDIKNILSKLNLDNLTAQVNEEFDILKKKYKELEQNIEEIKKMIISKLSAIKTSEEESKKLIYIGYIGILRQGCFGCHQIFGFSKAPKIGIELTGSNAIGSKDVEKLDFGYLDIPKTRWAWLAQKLKDPRSFDKNRILHYDEKLKMPQFHFTEDEIESAVTFLLGLTNEEITDKIKRNLSSKELAMELGKEVAINKNCISCHLFTRDTAILIDPKTNEYTKLEGLIKKYDKNKKIFTFSNLTPNEKYPFNIIKVDKNFYDVKNVFEGLGAYARESILSEEAKERGVPQERKYELIPFIPPPLYYEGFKVQKKWLNKFIREPFTLRPWLNIIMPKFRFSEEEVNNLIRFFSLYSNIDTPYEFYPQLSKEYLEGKLEQDKEYLQKGKTIFDKLGCVSCHILGNKKPSGEPDSWAPDLLLAKERLNPQWMTMWIQDPQLVQPQTKMPSLFQDEKQREIIKDMFDGDTKKQIEAIVDYILHGLKEEEK